MFFGTRRACYWSGGVSFCCQNRSVWSVFPDCQVKAMRCSDTKEQCGWRFGGSFIIKSSFQIPCFSALCSLPTPPHILHRNPIFIFSWWESNSLHSFFFPTFFRVTSERPHVILVSLNHITLLHTLPSPLVFPLKNSRIPSFSPNFASIHISPPPCVLFGGCQGRYGSESSSDGNEGDEGFAAHYARVYC